MAPAKAHRQRSDLRSGRCISDEARSLKAMCISEPGTRMCVSWSSALPVRLTGKPFSVSRRSSSGGGKGHVREGMREWDLPRIIVFCYESESRGSCLRISPFHRISPFLSNLSLLSYIIYLSLISLSLSLSQSSPAPRTHP